MRCLSQQNIIEDTSTKEGTKSLNIDYNKEIRKYLMQFLLHDLSKLDLKQVPEGGYRNINSASPNEQVWLSVSFTLYGKS